MNLTGGGTLVLSGLGGYNGPTTMGTILLDLDSGALGTNTVTINSGIILDNTSGSNVTLYKAPEVWNGDFAFARSANLNLGGGSVTALTGRLTASAMVKRNNGKITTGPRE